MRYKRVHIGEIIEIKVSELNLSVMAFAKLIGLQRQNVKKTVFLKSDIDTALLVTISEKLDFDFFQYYVPEKIENKKDYIKPIRGKLSLEFGEEKKEQVFKFEFGENNIEIFNR